MGDFMAIQTINLTVPGGDTPRSANTKINANFSNTTHAASRLVGTGTEQIPLTGQVFFAYNNTIPDAIFLAEVKRSCDDLAVGEIVLAGTVNENSPPSSAYNLITTQRGHATALVQTALGYNKPNLAQRTKYSGAWTEWATFYNTLNTTKDANGFIKAASPIVKVFADKVELNGDAESQNVMYTKNGIGDYTITTQSGLSTDGWYIELPKDMNGNPKVAVTLQETNGVISLKSYKRIFSMETFTFEPDLNEPLDIPDGRWIDLRLNEIPVEEVNP